MVLGRIYSFSEQYTPLVEVVELRPLAIPTLTHVKAVGLMESSDLSFKPSIMELNKLLFILDSFESLSASIMLSCY